jgi:hypothetical protein
MVRRMFHAEDPHIFGAPVQNLVVQVTQRPKFAQRLWNDCLQLRHYGFRLSTNRFYSGLWIVYISST